MFLQNKKSAFELQWDEKTVYGQIHEESEKEGSEYNFEKLDPQMAITLFDIYEKESQRLIKDKLLLPAYEYMLKSSHVFNMLDARGVISVTERASYIGRVRDLAKACAKIYMKKQ